MRFGEILALLVGAIVACAPAPPVPRAAPPAAPAPVEDAGPYWLEHEVDVPARPLAPIVGVYPPELRARSVQGEVEALVAVLPDGSVGGARLVSSSHDAFTAAARQAIDSARFQPALREGRSVASWVTVRLRFRLEQ